jgi:hypothetical protein
MAAKTGDQRPISRASGNPRSDRRAVVGASGRPEKGFVLDSGARKVAEALGRHDTPSGPRSRDLKTVGGGGVRFDVYGMRDQSIGRLDEGSALAEHFGREPQPGEVKTPGSIVGNPTLGSRKGER